MNRKPSLKQQAYQTIKQKILSCAYEPNTVLNELVLQEELQVSRTPIRDALSRLEQEGLVTILPKKGIAVSGISAQDVNMIFELRTMYEPYALLHYGARIPRETLEMFRSRFSDPKLPSRPEEYNRVDDDFHAAVIRATGNRFLQQSYAGIHDQGLRIRRLTANGQRLRRANQEHLGILDACIRREWALAADTMQNHLSTSRANIFERLEERQQLTGG